MLLKRNYLFIIINKTFTTLFFVYMIYQKPQILVIIRVRSPLPGASINYTDPVSQPLSSIFLFLGNSSCESFHAIPFKYPMILEVRPRNLCHNKKRDPTFAFYFPLSFCMNKTFRGKPRDPCSNYSSKKMTWKRLNLTQRHI